MDVAAWRRELRTRLIDRRMQLDLQEHQAANRKVEKFLEQTLRNIGPKTVSCYWPFKGEVDIRALMERLRSDGWQTALPVVSGRGKPLSFRHWTSSSKMELSVHDIPIPSTGELVRPDVVITPLVGFDEKNYRLGYGAGYFDITLSSMDPPPVKIGIGLELCRVPTIHPSPMDVPMDVIITEAGIQRI
jgi:5,10-methenyltetrahydrofolate synthetase